VADIDLRILIDSDIFALAVFYSILFTGQKSPPPVHVKLSLLHHADRYCCDGFARACSTLVRPKSGQPQKPVNSPMPILHYTWHCFRRARLMLKTDAALLVVIVMHPR
jgi:hypothetical protein